MKKTKWTTKHDNPQDGWTVDYDFDDDDEWPVDFGSVGVFDTNGIAICFVVSAPYDSISMERNARLIAAAPDMADALEEARDCVVACLNVEENASYSRLERAEYCRELLKKVDAALAKAGA